MPDTQQHDYKSILPQKDVIQYYMSMQQYNVLRLLNVALT